MRISRYLADKGLGSRRSIDRLIEQGRVQQNGHTITLGAQHEPGAQICVDGQPLEFSEHSQPRVLLYHKPTGEICTRSDPGGRRTVFEQLPAVSGGRWVAVGRLDYQTSGLLLFVSDGQIAQQLMHPRYGWHRVYHVKVQGDHRQALEAFSRGVSLDGEAVSVENVTVLEKLSEKNYWVALTLRSGKYRAVRRIFEGMNQRVVKLKRVQYAHYTLPTSLKEGQCIELSQGDVEELMKSLAKGGT